MFDTYTNMNELNNDEDINLPIITMPKAFELSDANSTNPTNRFIRNKARFKKEFPALYQDQSYPAP